jgi:hypothetical protein
MSVKLKLKLNDKDASYLTKVTVFSDALSKMEIYKTAPGNLAHEKMAPLVDSYRTHYQNGINGDRVSISLRNRARQELTDFCNQVLHFLQAVATEDDIPLLLQGGVQVDQDMRKKTSHSQQPVLATSGDNAG